MSTFRVAWMTLVITLISLLCYTPSAISDQIMNAAEKKLADLREKSAEASSLGLVDISGSEFEVTIPLHTHTNNKNDEIIRNL